MTRRLAGYDLNGWRDLCARTWLESPGEDAEENAEVIVSGGLTARVVKSGHDPRKPFVGGIQAQLSPNGRGDGWGAIGAAESYQVYDLMDDPLSKKTALSAALNAMASGADIAVMAIPDCEKSTEPHQEAWLAAMRKAGIRQPFLVWRPVLALLGILTQGGFSDRDRIGLILQHGEGFTTQILDIRTSSGGLTPERRVTGVLHHTSHNLISRRASAVELLTGKIGRFGAGEPLETSQTPGRIALGEDSQPELLRLRSGNWATVHAEPMKWISDESVLDDIAARLEVCTHVLLDTRVSEEISETLIQDFERVSGRNVRLLPRDCVARGALEAARRLSIGQPAFFDFLPQVSTMVQAKEGARTHNLVPENEVLPAGRIYRSRTPARFALSPGQSEISVYLLKENDPRPRLATLADVRPVTQKTKVELVLEQQPVAGRARLSVNSQAFPAPVLVDFDKAKVVGESWEDILEKHKIRPPGVPDRVILECGMDIWQGVSNRKGLAHFAKKEVLAKHPNWDRLTGYLSSRPGGKYAINSDGELPEGVRLDEEATLKQLIARALEEFETRLENGPYNDNQALKFLTWTFRMCPGEVVPPMLAALEQQNHPIRVNSAWKTLVLQGLGRVASAPNDIQAAFRAAMNESDDDWRIHHIASVGFLLSRTDVAPRCLDIADVERLSTIVSDRLSRELGGEYKQKFMYLPILLVGLLRWRLVDPWALVIGQDAMADRMAEPLDAIISDMKNRIASGENLTSRLEGLQATREALAGSENPGTLLADLYQLT